MGQRRSSTVFTKLDDLSCNTFPDTPTSITLLHPHRYPPNATPVCPTLYALQPQFATFAFLISSLSRQSDTFISLSCHYRTPGCHSTHKPTIYRTTPTPSPPP